MNITDYRDGTVAMLYYHKTNQFITENIPISAKTIYRIIDKYDLPKKGLKHNSNNGHWNVETAEERKEKALELYDEGQSIRDIADEIGVCVQTIYEYLKD